MNMKRILIVDDDSSVGTMLKFVIAREQLGEVVATVTDEEQAVDEILFYQPDIVLIDLLFPHTDGIRIMKRAMSRGAGSHFIMISQAHDKNMEEMAYKEGIDLSPSTCWRSARCCKMSFRSWKWSGCFPLCGRL